MPLRERCTLRLTQGGTEDPIDKGRRPLSAMFLRQFHGRMADGG